MITDLDTISSDDGHRLWPLPRLPWIMKQTWNDLLFAHYPIKLEKLPQLVPDTLPLDSFDGVGWVGVTPFHVTGMRPRGIHPIPGIRQFPELNVRTYVKIDGKPVRSDILHTPWPLQDAEAEFEENTMCISQGIEVASHKPILHYAKSREVSIWPLVSALGS